MYAKREARSLNKRKAKFIEQGKAKYGDQYDYTMAEKEYTNNRTPVHLICNRCKDDPFLVFPFAHTSSGDNQKGTCQNCYIPKQTVQETRWNPNLPERIKEFESKMIQKHGKNRYSYPKLEQEYKNEYSIITVQCNQCKTKPYTRLARALKAKDRYSGCENCNKEEMAETIKKKNQKRQRRNQMTKNMPRKYGCIYKITNSKNNKFYIGYTTLTAEKRFKAHKDESSKYAKGFKKSKSYLHHAMVYHGFEHFNVEVLKEFKNISPIELGELEMEYIASMKPDYNVSPGGELANYGKAS